MSRIGDHPTQDSPKSDAIAPITPHSSQDSATGLEETSKTGRFNEGRVVHLPQSTLNSKNFAQ
jgi:hypothetical protein